MHLGVWAKLAGARMHLDYQAGPSDELEEIVERVYHRVSDEISTSVEHQSGYRDIRVHRTNRIQCACHGGAMSNV